MNANTLQARLEAVFCPVCRTSIHGSVRCCSTCETAHHADCWNFSGGCAIYGCSQHGEGPQPALSRGPPVWLDPLHILVAHILIAILLMPFGPHGIKRNQLPSAAIVASIPGEISMEEARSRLGQLVLQASRGEPVVIRAGGQDPVQLLPFDPPADVHPRATR